MGLLKCNNDECVYNRGHRCQTDVLELSDGGACRSYQEGLKARRMRDYEFAAEFGIEGRDMYEAIDCYAECAFNKETHCTAGNVDMKEGLFYTKCKTRVKP